MVVLKAEDPWPVTALFVRIYKGIFMVSEKSEVAGGYDVRIGLQMSVKCHFGGSVPKFGISLLLG